MFAKMTSRQFGMFLVIGLAVIAFFTFAALFLRSCDSGLSQATAETAVPVVLATFTPSPKATPAAVTVVESEPAESRRLVDIVQPNRTPLGSDFHTKIPFLAVLAFVLWVVEARAKGWLWMMNFWVPLGTIILVIVSPLLPWSNVFWVIGPKANPAIFPIQSIGVLISAIILGWWSYGFRAPDKTSLAVTFGLPVMVSTIPVIGNNVGLGALGLSLGLSKTAALLPLTGALEAIGKSETFSSGALTLVVIGFGVICYVLLSEELTKWPMVRGAAILAQFVFLGIRFWWGVNFYLLWVIGMVALAILASFAPGRHDWGGMVQMVQEGHFQLPEVSDVLIVFTYGIWLFALISGVM